MISLIMAVWAAGSSTFLAKPAPQKMVLPALPVEVKTAAEPVKPETPKPAPETEEEGCGGE